MAAVLWLILIALTSAFAARAGEPDSSLARLLPPDTDLMLGIEWRRTLASSTGALIEKQFRQAGMPAIPGAAAFEKMVRDVDRLVLAAPARAVSAGSRQTPMLAVVQGRFDRAALRGWLQGRTETYRGIELIAPAGVKPPTTRVAVLDPNTLLFGDRRQLLAALDRRAAPGAAKNRLLERAAALAAWHDFWVVVNAPPGGFPVKPGDSGSQMLSHLEALEMGVRFSEGFALQADLRARSEDSAKSLAAMVQGLLAIAALSKDANPETAELLRKLTIEQTASTVRVSVALTQAEVERGFTSMQTASARPAPASQPAGPKKIRIIGMDAGPVELPVAP